MARSKHQFTRMSLWIGLQVGTKCKHSQASNVHHQCVHMVAPEIRKKLMHTAVTINRAAHSAQVPPLALMLSPATDVPNTR